MDRAILHQVVRHLRDDGEGEAPGTRRRKFVKAVRDLAKFLAEPEELGAYELMATDFPAVAQDLGFSKYPGFGTSKEELATHLEEVLKSIHGGKHFRLIPVFLQWMHKHGEANTNIFLKSVGFEYEKLQELLQGERGLSAGLAGTQASSPFSLKSLFRLANEKIILIAQNHWHLITERRHGDYKYWSMIADALLRGVDVQIVAMHPMAEPSGRGPMSEGGQPDAIAVWSHHMNALTFPAQIDEFWSVMEDWEQRYRQLVEEAEGPVGDFSAYGAYFTPLTMTVVDPSSGDGVIVLSPRIPDSKSAVRPLFIIRKSADESTFLYYFSYIQLAQSDQHWLRVVG